MNYDVNPGELRKLARGLREARTTIHDAGRLRADLGPAVGSAAVAHELREVSRNWSKARVILSEQLDALASAAEACALTYDGVEDELVHAMGAR